MKGNKTAWQGSTLTLAGSSNSLDNCLCWFLQTISKTLSRKFADTAFVIICYGYWEFSQFLLDRKFRTTVYIYVGRTFFKLRCA